MLKQSFPGREWGYAPVLEQSSALPAELAWGHNPTPAYCGTVRGGHIPLLCSARQAKRFVAGDTPDRAVCSDDMFLCQKMYSDDPASPDRTRALGEGRLAQVVRPPRGRRHRRVGRAGRGGPRGPGRRHELRRHHRHGSALRRGLHLGRRRHPGSQEGEARCGRQGQDHLVLQQEVHGGHHRQGRRLCPRSRSGEDCLRVQHLAFV